MIVANDFVGILRRGSQQFVQRIGFEHHAIGQVDKMAGRIVSHRLVNGPIPVSRHGQRLRWPDVTQWLIRLPATESNQTFEIGLRRGVVGDHELNVLQSLTQDGTNRIHGDFSAVAGGNHDYCANWFHAGRCRPGYFLA